jgi:hypothetical protein
MASVHKFPAVKTGRQGAFWRWLLSLLQAALSTS